MRFFSAIFNAIKSVFKKKDEVVLPKPSRPAPPEAKPVEVAPTKPTVKNRFEVDKKTQRFLGIKYVEDPDFGPVMTPRYIILHFTCSYSMQPTIEWFKSELVDIHLLAGKDGEVVQMAPFNRECSHAGPSQWEGVTRMNTKSIGIEVINIGPLVKKGTSFYDCYNRVWKGSVVERPMLGYRYWEPFTEIQEQNCVDMCAALCLEYGIKPQHVLAHYEVSPGRKVDVGGSLSISMDQFRKLVEARIKEIK